MTTELIEFIEARAQDLSPTDINQLNADLPRLRQSFTRIPSQNYPYLPAQLGFLCLFLEERVAALNSGVELIRRGNGT